MPPFCYWYTERRTRKDGPAEGWAEKCPVDTFLVRGRVLWSGDAFGMNVDTDQKHLNVRPFITGANTGGYLHFLPPVREKMQTSPFRRTKSNKSELFTSW